MRIGATAQILYLVGVGIALFVSAHPAAVIGLLALQVLLWILARMPVWELVRAAKRLLFFCLFLGLIGVHRFYVGKIGTGILMVLTLGGLGIWTLIDLILIAAGSFRDKEGRRVFLWTEPGSV